MIARTLCFSNIGKLSLKYEQLVWSAEPGEDRTVPIEDVGFVILESEKITITTALKVTDKQFENTIHIVGKKAKPPPATPLQLEFF